MEAAIRFSQNSLPDIGEQRFLRVDVTGKSFRLCKVTKQSRKSIQYEIQHSSTKVPSFRAFDWHPTNETLIAVGQPGSEATLLNIADGQQDSISFPIRSQRLCNAVALSSQNLLAVGLDRVRTDACLHIWDFNQRLPATTSTSRNFSKSYTEPLHKLAVGEPITTLKFFNNNPQLLVAGVKGQFIRLYDLREPASNNVLQFATRCVNNAAIDSQDDNYFASCYPTNDPLVCIWDRRMIARTTGGQAVYNSSGQVEKQAGASLELKDVSEGSESIWSLRFSKSRRGCLGILSNSGHLKVYNVAEDFDPDRRQPVVDLVDSTGVMEHPPDVYVDSTEDVERSYFMPSATRDEKRKIVSFDFMTGNTRSGQPKMILLDSNGDIRMTSLKATPEPVRLSPSGLLCNGAFFHAAPALSSAMTDLPSTIDRIRRRAEPRNSLKQAMKNHKQKKNTSQSQHLDLRRMSSFANHCWNSDLGFYEKDVSLEDLLTLVSTSRFRCEAGYLLNASKNKKIANDSQWIESFWNWIERAERISKNRGMVQDNLDLSFVGVSGIWMEEVHIAQPATEYSPELLPTAIKNLVNRLHLPQRRGCGTEYPWHRKLCLYISGLGWSHEELETMVQKLVTNSHHTKAAALAIFAGEEKLAYKALRARTATQNHKMLAMAIAGASKRKKKLSEDVSPTKDSSEDDTEDDWMESIANLSQDLADPYARAILAYVKSGNWEDVVNEDALPLKDRVGVALRHLSDSELTPFIGRLTREVIANGDIEGIMLTGTSTRKGLELLQSFTRVFGDLQTSVLGLIAGGAPGRFTITATTITEDRAAARKLEAFREAYRTTIMSWGLKFDRVRLDVASSRALSFYNPTQINPPRPKEQVRLVCGYCSQNLTQFEENANPNGITTLTTKTPSIMETAKNPLTPEKAATIGTVCPKCGRHLPRCGVCDLWLGTPDDSYTKWTTAGREHNPNTSQKLEGQLTIGGRRASATTARDSVDLNASMTNSVITTIGPSPSTTRKSSSTPRRTSHNQSNSNSQSRSRQPSRTRSPLSALRSLKSSKPPIDLAIEDPDPDSDPTDADREAEIQRTNQARETQAKEAKWRDAMQKFIVFCVSCSHGFHAGHARMWFEGVGGMGGQGRRVCPVPGCGCFCNG